MSAQNESEQSFEHQIPDSKASRQKKFETQKRIYEFKEQQRLRKEQSSYLDDEYDDKY